MTSIDQMIELILDMQGSEQPETDEDAEYQAYRDVALHDIFYRIIDRPKEDPEELLYWFMVEMEGYRLLQEHHKINQFDVAIETACTVLAMLEHPQE